MSVVIADVGEAFAVVVVEADLADPLTDVLAGPEWDLPSGISYRFAAGVIECRLK